MESVSANPFLLLPIESNIAIFQYLRINNLVACKLTCYHFNQLTYDSSLKWIWYQAASDHFFSFIEKQMDPLFRIIGFLTFAETTPISPEKQVEACKLADLATISFKGDQKTLIKIAFRFIQSGIQQASDNKESARVLLNSAEVILIQLHQDRPSCSDAAFGLTAIGKAKIKSNIEDYKAKLSVAYRKTINLCGDCYQAIILGHITDTYQQLGVKKIAQKFLNESLNCVPNNNVSKRLVNCILEEIGYLNLSQLQQGVSDEDENQPTILYSQIYALLSGTIPKVSISVDASIEKQFEQQLQILEEFKEGHIKEALKINALALQNIGS